MADRRTGRSGHGSGADDAQRRGAVWPEERRGYALGILAGGSAFFAALGPVLGGLLTAIDWRLVLLINVPLAVAAIAITLSATPRLDPPGERRPIDYPVAATFGLAIAALVYGLSQGQPQGWTSAQTLVPPAVSVLGLVGFVVIEHRVREPLIEFRLFRNLNFLAANVSQMLRRRGRARPRLPGPVLAAAGDRRRPSRRGHRAVARHDPGDPGRPAGRPHVRPRGRPDPVGGGLSRPLRVGRATEGAPLAWLRYEETSERMGSVELRLRSWPGGAEELLARGGLHFAPVDWLAG